MNLIAQIYASAASAGLLRNCLWRPLNGAPVQQHPVGFTAPDETVLDGLSLNTDYVMRFPASVFPGLSTREPVEIDGDLFLVRELRVVGDGSEMRASLTRL